MRDISVTGGLPIPDNRWLHKLSDATGTGLPAEYIDFLREHNGGEPSPGMFRLPGDPPERLFWIDFFCSLDREVLDGSGDSDYRSLAFSHHHYARIVPQGCLIIARASRDDFVVLFHHGPRAGQVFYKRMWDVVDVPQDQWPAHREMGLHFAASSFTDFLDMLMEDPGSAGTEKPQTRAVKARKKASGIVQKSTKPRRA